MNKIELKQFKANERIRIRNEKMQIIQNSIKKASEQEIELQKFKSDEKLRIKNEKINALKTSLKDSSDSELERFLQYIENTVVEEVEKKMKKKLISFSEQVMTDLRVLAAKANKSLNEYIREVLIKEVENSKKSMII